ncbi:hypothetical protein C8R46DRAFT_1301105 [Mycena filopes]|nr:hypothetical protein C8R46DRAFT_1301105 [Mycena filopes]
MTIRFVVMFHRLPHLSLEQFDKYWSEIHGPLVKDLPAVKSGLVKYKQASHSLFNSPGFHISPKANALLAANGLPVISHDGHAELEADRIEDILEFLGSEGVTNILLPDEKNFVSSLQVISGNWTQ